MHQGDYPIPPQHQHQPQPPPQQPYYQQQQHFPQTPYHPPNPPVHPSPISLPGAATNASASAPPFSPSPSDYPNYPSFPHHCPDPTPHTTPFYPPQPPQPPQTTPYYPPYDPHPNPNPVSYPTPYDPAPNYDPAPPYFDDNSTGYATFGPTRATLGGGAYDYSKDNGSTKSNYGGGSYEYNDGLSSRSNYGGGSYEYGKDDGVYAYEGKSEPYGARGTGSSSFKSKSSDWSGLFDDYGRAISFPKDEEKKSSGGDRYSGSGSGSGSGALKVVRAVPKAEDKNDGKSGVQKFRVKLLAESGGQSAMDVLCMVGLDGIRMLDPTTSRTLRIYPLENVTRCDKIDSSTFAFWSKTSVDVEPRRIRLQSNSYTTNTILDTVTAATVQFKEMGGRSRPSESPKAVDLASEKKKGLGDWINRLKPLNEEKDHWVPDEAVSKCTGCGSDFSAFNRRHHCRNCGDVFCDKCTQGRTPLTSEENAQPVRVCDRCMAEVTHRLSKAKEAAGRPVTLQSHEELAKKLQEEMEKNLRISSGSKSEGSGKRMKEVACPTCTVHLQVQVPSSGSETIECGVCQHPFIVSAN